MSVRGTCRVCAAWFVGKQNHCTICHQTFASERGGDSHRTGSYEVARRCRDAAEMVAGGMWQDERGIWHGAWNKRGEQRRRVAT